MREKIKEALQAAYRGSRKIRVTFKRSSAGDVNYLLGMANSGILQIAENDVVVMMAVALSGHWDGDENRTTTLTLADPFDEKWFVGRMERALEKVEAINA